MSTYSSNLRIELITTGTQAGTWGTTTNTNLGTLIEGAVAGYSVVTVTSTAQALTANNGAADESRLAMLQLTTSGVSTAFAVYAPPATKQYTIYNASSYTATIYNSTVLGNTTAAGTGVDIPAGSTMTIWSNGTSFFQQNTYLNTPLLNAPAISGVSSAPTATFGNSTSQLATTAFVQAALQALHPVGSIYTSTSSTNPGTSFGFGTWVAFGAGRVLIGQDGSGYIAGATGGSADAIAVAHTHTFSATSGAMSANASHTHTASDSGHTHSAFVQTQIGGTSSGPDANWWRKDASSTGTGYANVTNSTTNTDHTHSVSGTTGSTGSSGTGANLQPYVVVYMWTRTA